MTDVASILPPNSSPLELNLEQTTARLGEVALPSATLWNATTCPEAFLPYLAWSLQVETWRSDWPVATKRAVIAATPAAKRVKGSVGSVRRALAALGARMETSEWFETGGAPYTATVRVYAQGASGMAQLSPDLLSDMQTVLASYAPARAKITALFGVEFSPVNIGCAMTRSLTRAKVAARLQAGLGGALHLGGAIMRPIEVMRVSAETILPTGDGQLSGLDPGNISLATVL